MRKKRSAGFLPWVIPGLIGGILIMSLFGCAQKYRVDYDGQKDSYRGAKDAYRAGEHVKLCYDLIATDTDYSFSLEGAELDLSYNEKDGYVLRFTMPAHDVRLTCTWVNSMSIIETPEAERMLVNYYSSSTAAADDGSSYELALFRRPDGTLSLKEYRDGEETGVFDAPEETLNSCLAVIRDGNLTEWNDLTDYESLDGALTVCRFDAGGETIRVSTEHMPPDGLEKLNKIRDALLTCRAEGIPSEEE